MVFFWAQMRATYAYSTMRVNQIPYNFEVNDMDLDDADDDVVRHTHDNKKDESQININESEEKKGKFIFPYL